MAVPHWVGNQPAPYRGLSGPPGPKSPKKSRKCLPGPPAPGPQKVSKKSRGQSKNTLQTLSGDSPETSRTVPETFLRLFGVPGPEAPGDIFETFLGFRARRARETSVRGGLVPNHWESGLYGYCRGFPMLVSLLWWEQQVQCFNSSNGGEQKSAHLDFW